MEDSVLKDTVIQDLSSHYQNVIKSYLKYGRHRAELHLKDIQTQMDALSDSRYEEHICFVVTIKSNVNGTLEYWTLLLLRVKY
jgi:hypothetical protein